jgi:hypothetical protein
MGIKPLENLPEHIMDHEAIGVKSRSYNDNRYVTITTQQTITGQKQVNNDFILQSGRKLIFDG